MLEREKNTIAKKCETKIEDYTNKVSCLESQLAEWETHAGSMEETVRKTAEEGEAKLAEEKVKTRNVEFDLDKAQTKIKAMESEMVELRDSCSKIDEYEQVLGKLMERNEELEQEVKSAKDEVDTAHRQLELADRRRAVKVKDLEDKVEEQRVMIEQQQETLDESVKTILKLYSLNNERGDDLSVLSEERLTDMARQMVPRVGGGGTSRSSGLPPIHDEDQRGGGGETRSRASGYTGIRSSSSTARRSTAQRSISTPVSGRVKDTNSQAISTPVSGRVKDTNSQAISTPVSGRVKEFNDEVENILQEQSRARSRGPRGRMGNEADVDKTTTKESQVRAQSRGRNNRMMEAHMDSNRPTRSKSRGRGERTESIRQLTERDRTPGGRTSSRERYDPSGPISDSRALVHVTPKESDNPYGIGGGDYDIPSPRRRSNSRYRGRGGGGGDDLRASFNDPYNDDYNSSRQQPAYDRRPSSSGRSRHRNSQHGRQQPQQQSHHHQPGGNYRSNNNDRDKDRPERDRRSERDHRRERDRDRDRDPHHDRRSNRDDPNYYRDSREREMIPRNSTSSGYGQPKEDMYHHHRSSSARDPSVSGNEMGEIILFEQDGGEERNWSGGGSGGRRHSRGRVTGRSSSMRDP